MPNASHRRPFEASLLLALRKVLLVEFIGPSPNTFWLFFGSEFSIAKSLGLTFQILGRLFFSGSFRTMVRLSRSISIHCSRFASPDLIAVSFRSCSSTAT